LFGRYVGASATKTIDGVRKDNGREYIFRAFLSDPNSVCILSPTFIHLHPHLSRFRREEILCSSWRVWMDGWMDGGNDEIQHPAASFHEPQETERMRMGSLGISIFWIHPFSSCLNPLIGLDAPPFVLAHLPFTTNASLVHDALHALHGSWFFIPCPETKFSVPSPCCSSNNSFCSLSVTLFSGNSPIRIISATFPSQDPEEPGILPLLVFTPPRNNPPRSSYRQVFLPPRPLSTRGTQEEQGATRTKFLFVPIILLSKVYGGRAKLEISFQ